MENLLMSIPILLVLSSAITGFSSKKLNNISAGIISSMLVFISLVFSLIIFYHSLNSDNSILYDDFYQWISINGLNIGMGYLIDKLSAMMMVVVLLISFVVHVYSIGYMRDEQDFKRFFSYIALFTFSMILLVMSNNLIQLFIGWEGVGLVSYLLIGFFYKKESAIKANLKAFLINRIGDMFFIIGIIMIFGLLDSFDYKTMFSNLKLVDIDNIDHYYGFSYIDIACFFLFIGAMAKSAQIPLHVWLPDSMEGPTPISALIHAATMVTAGIFMVARLSPIYSFAEVTTDFILIIGALTALFIGVIAIFENDIKKVIAYSTISQLGYMVSALGINAYTVSFFHLYTHAFFKALLFLCAGSVIMSLHHNQDITKMGGLRERLPITHFCFLVGTLCIIGFPLTSGFFSKDLILEVMLYENTDLSFFVYILLLVGAFVTTVYSLRLIFIVFYGKYRDGDIQKVEEESFVILSPLIILATLSLFSGFVINTFVELPIFMYGIKEIHYEGLMPFISHGVLSPASITLIAGFFIAKYLYLDNKKLSFLSNKYMGKISMIIKSKYKFDEFFLSCSDLMKWISHLAATKFDIKVIDSFFVNGLPRKINKLSGYFKSISSGYLYHYAFLIVFSLVVIFGIILTRVL